MQKSSLQEMSTVTAAIEMRRLDITRGPITHLTMAPRCKVSVTLFGQDRRKEWKTKKKKYHMRWIWGTKTRSQIATKDRNKSYCTRAVRASKLHHLLNHHHSPNGEGIHMPVCDISKVEGWLRMYSGRTKYQPSTPGGLHSSA